MIKFNNDEIVSIKYQGNDIQSVLFQNQEIYSGKTIQWLDWNNSGGPLTVELLENCILDRSTILGEGKIQCSLDNGTTWIDCTEQDFVPIQLLAGNKVCFRGYLKSGEFKGLSFVKDDPLASPVRFNLSGNLNSLINITNVYDLSYSVLVGFFEKSGVVDASKLILDGGCYVNLFSDCENLIYPPYEIKGTANCCGMFMNCTSLKYSPKLPQKTIVKACYEKMFYNCTSLLAAPVGLPATTLAESCYEKMFYNCTSLLNAPVLPATTLARSCYTDMFFNCNNLHEITCLATSNMNLSGVTSMMSGIETTGTFIKHPYTLESSLTIPSSWEFKSSLITRKFTVTLLESGTITLRIPGEFTSSDIWSCTYGNKEREWRETTVYHTPGTDTLISLNLNGSLDATFEIRGNSFYKELQGQSYHCEFSSSVPFKISGNINKLFKIESQYGEEDYYYGGKFKNFSELFKNCTNLVSAEYLFIPESNNNMIFSEMFSGCSQLQTAPKLPMTLNGCDGCYFEMFKGCSSLTTAPDLLADATTSGCYCRMFEDCTSLNYVKAMFLNDPGVTYDCLGWLQNVSPTGTFVKSDRATWNSTGNSACPYGWTIETASV